ncbi:hypothetical protein Glove_322g12 [Diversispora epigaea]|uniref:Uncharacterized protein n=1 Tax=Diversispora epigaea TaxID=1348612 RepID=A0A397HRF4_9GLOM|nr:hypothetical protein Glove_322g12 [Diversispora epigaea]
MTHFEANKVKPTLVLASTREELQVITDNWKNQKATAIEYSWITLPNIIIGLKQRCERLIIWEKSKNITTNNKRSNKSKFISNNSLAVIEQEVVFDDIPTYPYKKSYT